MEKPQASHGRVRSVVRQLVGSQHHKVSNWRNVQRSLEPTVSAVCTVSDPNHAPRLLTSGERQGLQRRAFTWAFPTHRYFCRDTPYAAQWPMLDSDTTLPGCGGAPAYAFKTPEPDSSEAFYTWLMDYGKTHWGMSRCCHFGPPTIVKRTVVGCSPCYAPRRSFEPDFLHQNFVCVSEFLANATAAKVWFDGMSAAATKQNLAMQWCMATPADVLNALSYPSVTNFRVTTDYYYGHSWDVGCPTSLATIAASPRHHTLRGPSRVS